MFLESSSSGTGPIPISYAGLLWQGFVIGHGGFLSWVVVAPREVLTNTPVWVSPLSFWHNWSGVVYQARFTWIKGFVTGIWPYALVGAGETVSVRCCFESDTEAWSPQCRQSGREDEFKLGESKKPARSRNDGLKSGQSLLPLTWTVWVSKAAQALLTQLHTHTWPRSWRSWRRI